MPEVSLILSYQSAMLVQEGGTTVISVLVSTRKWKPMEGSVMLRDKLVVGQSQLSF